MQKNGAATVEQVSRTIELLQRKWTVPILWAMRTEAVRLSTLKRLYPEASKKALRAGLRDLEDAKLVVRYDLTDVLLHVEYRIANELQNTLCDLLDGLAVFGAMIGPKAPVASVERRPKAEEPSLWR